MKYFMLSGTSNRNSSAIQVVVHRIPRREDDARVLPQVDALLAERLAIHAFDMDETAEIDLELVLVSQVKIR